MTRHALLLLTGLCLTGLAAAQGTAPATPATAPAPATAPPAAAPTTGAASDPAAPPVIDDITSIQSLAWLNGCWAGNVNQRDFREQWGPVRATMILGYGSTVYQGKVQDFEFLRIEQRPDGVYYIAMPEGKKETPFKLGSITSDIKDTVYSFSNGANDFPQEILYRRASEGWLYATIQGKLNGQDRKVIFPMRRVDCESGEFIRH